MNPRSLQLSIGAIIQIAVSGLVLSLLLAACGGGKSAGDTYPALPVAAPGFSGPNSFLLFPNSIKQSDASYQIDTLAYAQSYYKAIDPNNDRDTYDKWLAANQFGSASGSEVTVTVGDKRDLGYGRYITARKNTDGTIAISVRNYLVPVAAGYGYSTMNMDAAVARDDRWYIGSSNIEFSPASPASGVAGVGFAKFYFFAPDGARLNMVNLDGRGAKAMPGPCISCHGGRGDPLTAPDDNGVQLFPLVQNSASLARGDVQGHFHPLEPDNFDFSSIAGFTRADQEAAIKLINTWVLSSYPLPYDPARPTGYTTVFPEDAGRRTANQFEWQGVAAALIKDGYGGDGLPNDRYVDSVPASWAAVGQSTLYQESFVPACRVCHVLRGMGRPVDGQGSDIDMTTFSKFDGYADQIKAHVFDSGNMPLAKILYEKFWSSSAQVNAMATYLENASGVSYTVRDTSGTVLKPGRPVAVAGPDRVVTGTTTLSAAASMYATTYSWAIASDPVGGAVLADAATATPTLVPAGNGTYVLSLVVGKDGVQSDPSHVTVVVNSALTPAPSAITFTTHIKPILQGTELPLLPAGQQCIACHTTIGVAKAPVAYNKFDRNGNGVDDSGTVNSKDDYWLYTDIKGRINLDDVGDSPILLKPSGHHHGGYMLPGFGKDPANILPDILPEKLVPGDPRRAKYDLFLNWILNGAPY